MREVKFRGRALLISLLLFVLAAAALVALACKENSSGPETPSPATAASPKVTTIFATSTPPTLQFSPRPAEVEPTKNVFGNPGFEDDKLPWFALKPPDFEISDVAHSGKSSALLRMREPPEAAGAKVFYLVQEVAPTEFPEVISGYYRVENWIKGTAKQYLQFVVIAFASENAPEGFPNHQIRYLLAGINSDPFAIANAQFVYLSREEPVTGEWVPFKVNVKQDFIDLWGAAPEGYERIRLLFEVRYDDRVPGNTSSEADVYYDDLYFGPAAGAPQ
jgi:hypothetical protein